MYWQDYYCRASYYLCKMPDNEVNTIPHRSQAVPLLAQKFVRDYENVVKGYHTLQKLELTDHLISVLEVMTQYEETGDAAIWEKHKDKEETLLKKYGRALKPYSDLSFYKYFHFDTVLAEKGIYSAEEFNRLSPDEQGLSSKERHAFFRLCRNTLLNAKSFLYLQMEPENVEAITDIADETDSDPAFTKARQLLAIFYLLKASFDLEPRTTHPVSAFARFAHLLTGTKITNLQNSDIYKKYSQMPDYKSGALLIDDLKFIRPYFEELNIVKALELIDEQIDEAAKKLRRR